MSQSVLGGSSNFLEKLQLLRLKQKAMRAGVWYKALQRIDRVLIDLTMRVVDIVRSASLAKSILAIVRKLEELLESKLARAIRQIGFSLACKISAFAQQWGNKAAREWVNDVGFARYLAVMNLNGHVFKF